MSILILTHENGDYGQAGSMMPQVAVVGLPRWNPAGITSVLIMSVILCAALVYGIGFYLSFGAEMDIARGRKDVSLLREQVAELEHEVLQQEQTIAVTYVDVIGVMEEVSSIQFIEHESVAQSMSMHTP